MWSVSKSARILATADPVTGISFGRLLLTVGLFELAIAGICLFGKSQKCALALVAWLAAGIAAGPGDGTAGGWIQREGNGGRIGLPKPDQFLP